MRMSIITFDEGAKNGIFNYGKIEGFNCEPTLTQVENGPQQQPLKNIPCTPHFVMAYDKQFSIVPANMRPNGRILARLGLLTQLVIAMCGQISCVFDLFPGTFAMTRTVQANYQHERGAQMNVPTFIGNSYWDSDQELKIDSTELYNNGTYAKLTWFTNANRCIGQIFEDKLGNHTLPSLVIFDPPHVGNCVGGNTWLFQFFLLCEHLMSGKAQSNACVFMNLPIDSDRNVKNQLAKVHNALSTHNGFMVRSGALVPFSTKSLVVGQLLQHKDYAAAKQDGRLWKATTYDTQCVNIMFIPKCYGLTNMDPRFYVTIEDWCRGVKGQSDRPQAVAVTELALEGGKPSKRLSNQ